MKPIEIVVFVSLGVALLFVAALLWSVREGDEDWNEFSQAHHCVSLADTEGRDRAGWRCDDGKVYYRWRQQR
ncbi:cbb3-type cytochrome oxidase assembly protein CcoS [Methylocaldum sp.]|uniref:cbb3-type cytochrome oxidase assembly protein CcoS n=1 Tax=Methylocaldum sp. TaxID=1969727 RepID=UPI002D27A7DF|nr:cbb3-type cytochrome oxidase assembly protein CcoS [Methylocaldum sp.]HYE35368.1 cbb3-type cytochrome oxidase assembly protein CcoS [Methylocaldum sp.]